MTEPNNLGERSAPETISEAACFIHDKGRVLVILNCPEIGMMRIELIPHDTTKHGVMTDLTADEVDIVRIMLQRSTPTGVLNREKQS
jgi:hypothetical protein